MINGSETKAKVFITSCLALFVSIIVLVAVVFNSLRVDSVKVLNISSVNSDGLDNKVVDMASKAIYSFLKRFGYDVSRSDVSIRGVSNYNKDSGSGIFLVDVDSIKQTFRFYYDGEEYSIGCPYIEESNYPDSYCIANSRENDDTATMVLGNILPYDGITDSGVGYRVYREDLDDDLYVHIFACGGDSEAYSSAKASIESLIKDRGANPDIFPINYEYNNCNE